jgi:ribosomal protein S18 acetylase RimI-like enzyme
VSFWVKPDLGHGDIVTEVPMLAVSEESRRAGVGQALMVEVRQRAAEKGAALIELVTVPSNVAARDFYRSLGFVETDHIVLEFVGEMDDPPE